MAKIIYDLNQKEICRIKLDSLVNVQWSRRNLTGADLSGEDMTGANLAGTNLTGANLRGTKMVKALLIGSNLTNADMTEANLTEVAFTNTNLQNATLSNATLIDADLSEAKNLLSSQLRGTDLTNAKLPVAIAKFDETKHLDDRIKDTGKFFIALLTADIYSLLTLWSSRKIDIALLDKNSDAKLPLFGNSVSLLTFCYLAPLILLAIYVYFQTELQHIWEGIVRLPAVFPDGNPFHRRIYPWFVPSIIEPRFPQLHKSSQSHNTSWVFMKTQRLFACLLVWFTTPMVLSAIWLTHIKLREWPGTVWLFLLLSFGIVWGSMAFRNTKIVSQEDSMSQSVTLLQGAGEAKTVDMLLKVRHTIVMAGELSTAIILICTLYFEYTWDFKYTLYNFVCFFRNYSPSPCGKMGLPSISCCKAGRSE